MDYKDKVAQTYPNLDLSNILVDGAMPEEEEEEGAAEEEEARIDELIIEGPELVATVTEGSEEPAIFPEMNT